MQGLILSSSTFVLLMTAASLLPAETAPYSESAKMHEHAEHEEHSTHEHGVGSLSIAVANETIEIQLDSPSANVFGFEHEPSSEADKKTITEVSAKLQAGLGLFEFDKDAKCKLEKAELTNASEYAEGQSNSKAHEHTGEHNAPTHRDIAVNWLFSCEQPSALKTITLQLFSKFSGFKKLEVKWITHQNASAKTLEQDEVITLAP